MVQRVPPNVRFAELFEEVFRVLKRDTHFYLMCDPETAFIAKPVAEQAGFKFWKPLVWDKRSIGMGYHYRARYEFVLFFEKGKRRLADLGIADVLEVPRIRGGFTRPEKPERFDRDLHSPKHRRWRFGGRSIHGLGFEGGVAALKLDRRYVGNDVSDDSLKLARERLLVTGGVEGPVIVRPAHAEPAQQRLALG